MAFSSRPVYYEELYLALSVGLCTRRAGVAGRLVGCSAHSRARRAAPGWCVAGPTLN